MILKDYEDDFSHVYVTENFSSLDVAGSIPYLIPATLLM
jgi:hypothetical protein